MSADKSERSGTRLNTPSIFAESTSNQVGFSLCSANSNDALIRACFLDFSRTATTSFYRKLWKEWDIYNTTIYDNRFVAH